MKGRKPKPRRLRILEGTAERADRPLNEREPEPAASLPKAPRHLSKAAKTHWRKFARVLYDCGLLTTIDTVALEGLCNLYVRYVTAAKQVAELAPIRLIKVHAESGEACLPEVWENPWVREMDRTWKQLRVLLAEFGMTPSARTRIQVDKPKTPDSLSAFAKRKPKREIS